MFQTSRFCDSQLSGEMAAGYDSVDSNLLCTEVKTSGTASPAVPGGSKARLEGVVAHSVITSV